MLNGFFETLVEVCEAYNKESEKEKERKKNLRKEFEKETKDYNRGTVISAMAAQGWDSWDMNRVLEAVTNHEKAEAAVGLINSEKYDSWDICRILDKI